MAHRNCGDKMTIEELVELANAVKVDSTNIDALRASLEETERQFEREEQEKCVNNDYLSRSYSF